MLGLSLRKEFRGRRLEGTAIELTNKNDTGATQIPAKSFLGITYPTYDVCKLLEAASPSQGRPITIIGSRGQGKSHLMAVLYHALKSKQETVNWLKHWAEVLGNEKLASIPIREGMEVISENVHRQRYKYLWDLLFDRHPHGGYCKGKWEGLGEKKTDVPSDEILFEMFQHTPTALILDEFQTWFDGLTNTKQYPHRTWAFNFIQVLSEIAKEHPDLLLLVTSVRDGSTDAFQQIHRVNPVLVDFQGPSAKRDRLRLLLHRLFENRVQVTDQKIADLTAVHVSEYFRLLDSAPADRDRIKQEFIDAWPFAPHLMQLLEDQVLIATHAQETRDLIRILADLFKRRGETEPIITAADFILSDDASGIAALLDSVSNQHHHKLREKAIRNLEAVKTAASNMDVNVPNAEIVISALWLRSLADMHHAGADQATLQVDITKGEHIDDNAFQAEMAAIVENSFNIHPDGNRWVFKEEDNAGAKLSASARNDKLFTEGQDTDRLRKEIRYVIGGDSDTASKFIVIALERFWKADPWSALSDPEKPENWGDRIPIIILPESTGLIEEQLGEWLVKNLLSKRNIVRYLLPREGSDNTFADRELITLARRIYLAELWRRDNPEYKELLNKYQKNLRDILKNRFDRFAILAVWNFQEPKNCKFHIESHQSQGNQIPDAIDKRITENLFIPEEFDEFILHAAQENESVGKLFRELQDPRPGGADCIPWLGETMFKERVIKLCCKGMIAINRMGMEMLQLLDGETTETAWLRLRGKLGTGKHLDETHILLPQNIPGAGGGQQPPKPVEPIIGGENTGGQAGQKEETKGEGQFTGGATAAKLVPYSAPATSALNLLGKIEDWGVNPGSQLHSMAIKVDQLTGAQLLNLVKKLPDGMTYSLGLEKEES